MRILEGKTTVCMCVCVWVIIVKGAEKVCACAEEDDEGAPNWGRAGDDAEENSFRFRFPL